MRSKNIFPLVLAAAIIFAAPMVKAQSLEPGGSVDLLAAEGICDTVVSVDPDDPAVTASADCDTDLNGLLSLSGIDSILDTAATADASASLSYVFDVEDDDGAGNTIMATLDYSIAWTGLSEAVSGTASATIVIDVVDLTTAKRNKSVGSVTVYEVEITDGSLDDTDSATDSLALELIRGHEYTVSVELATGAVADATSEEELTQADYFNPDNGATIAALSVNSDFDIAELVEQVMQNTADIAANAEDIAANSTAIDENSTAIAANTDKIAENSDAIVVNAEGIAVNAEGVAVNAAAIVVNAEGIAANAAAIAANTEAIAANTAAIAALGDSLDDLAELLAALRDEFDGHSHTYLTGRGNGHNNTEATTTAPNGDDDDDAETQPLPSQSQGQGRALGRNR